MGDDCDGARTGSAGGENLRAPAGRPAKQSRVGRQFKGPYWIGPNRHGSGWRVRLRKHPGPRGTTNSPVYPTYEEALQHRQEGERQLASLQLTVEGTLPEYRKWLIAVGHKRPNKPESADLQVNWVRRFFGGATCPLHALRTSTIETCYRALRESGKWKPKAGAAKGARERDASDHLRADTHRNVLSAVKSYLKWCVKVQHYLAKNPADDVKGVGERSEGKEQLELDQLRKWEGIAWALAGGGDHGAIVALLTLHVGARAQELTKRRVRDVASFFQPNDTIVIKKGKTKKASRTLGLPAELQPFVAMLIEGRDGDEPLFPGKAKKGRDHVAGAPIATPHHDRNWPRKQVRRICRMAGVPDVCAHAMRGTLANLGVRMDPIAIRDYLGHEHLRTTATYAGTDAIEEGQRSAGRRALRGAR